MKHIRGEKMDRKKIVCIAESAEEEARLTGEIQERLGERYEVLPGTRGNEHTVDGIVQSILPVRPLDTLVLLPGEAPKVDIERLLCTLLAVAMWNEQHNYSSLHDCFSRRVILAAEETQANIKLAEKYHISFVSVYSAADCPASRYGLGRRIAERLRALY